jgi:asparaginyl-tRNA synthetase
MTQATSLTSTSDNLRQLRISSAVHAIALESVRRHYTEFGMREMSVPVLVGITGACENIATLFRVTGSDEVHLTQTGQLALEHALQQADGVFCITKSFRTDLIDARHLAEFTLVEEEFGCTHSSVRMPVETYNPGEMFTHLLDHISSAVIAMFRGVLDAADSSAGEDLATGLDIRRLEELVNASFPEISYDDAIAKLNKIGTETIEWGDDLGSKEEQSTIELVAEETGRGPLPTFVTHYPKQIKFFNMKVDAEDVRVVQSADLLLPGVGEAVGSAVREHEYDKLRDRLLSSTMFRHLVEQQMASIEDFEPYLAIIENRLTAPHAGYGIGLERVIQFIMAESDIRRCSPSYLLNDMMGFNDHLVRMQTGNHAREGF